MSILERMSELAEPIEKQIMMCDSREEILMIACVMLQRTKEIFDQELSVEGRKKMFKDFV
jgi:hypothetical protein